MRFPIQRIHQVEGPESTFKIKKGNFCTTNFVWFVLTTQKELEALLWICFTPRYIFLKFRIKIFSRFFHPKIVWSKKIVDFFLGILGNFKSRFSKKFNFFSAFFFRSNNFR